MLKESEKVHEYSQACQAGIVVKKTVIVKWKTENCDKACKKTLNIFAIGTLPDSMDDIIFSYRWRAKLA